MQEDNQPLYENEAYLALMHLRPLMRRASGSPDVSIGVIDGPVDLTHPAFTTARIRAVHDQTQPIECQDHESASCVHGTFVTGVLCGQRRGVAPALCPHCEDRKSTRLNSSHRL